MKNKVKKYAKFLVCMGLILGLMAPSYAALSASDGSAFVTKSEFDSALADFNSRLTTFEAGINSKIDSQVTSYLDRNGIWSGKEQDIRTDYECKAWVCTDKSKSKIKLRAFGWSNSTSSDRYPLAYNGDKNQKIVNNLTKSGLACLGICIADYHNFITSASGDFDFSKDRMRIACSEADGHPLNHNDMLYFSFSIFTDDGEKWTYRLEKNTINAMTLIEEPDQVEYIYFFVRSGHSLIASGESGCGKAELGEWDDISTSTTNINKWGKKLLVNSCDIY